MERVCTLDSGQPALFNDDLAQRFPPLDRAEFVQLKAPLVIYTLERTIGRPMMQHVLRRLVTQALGKDLQLAVSTQQFLRLVRKVRTTRAEVRGWTSTETGVGRESDPS